MNENANNVDVAQRLRELADKIERGELILKSATFESVDSFDEVLYRDGSLRRVEMILGVTGPRS